MSDFSFAAAVEIFLWLYFIELKILLNFFSHLSSLSFQSLSIYIFFFCLFGFCLLVGPKCRTDANKVSNSWSKLNKWLTKHMYLREYEYVCLFLFLFLNLVHIFVTIVNIKWYYINFYRIRFEYSTKKKSIVFLQTYNKKCVCVLVLA